MDGEFYGRRFYYEINGLRPDRGTFDFSIRLDPVFAKKALEYPLKNTRIEEIVSSVLNYYGDKNSKKNFEFAKKGTLLKYISLPGKKAHISLEEKGDSPWLYHATGIKNAKEAHGLLAIWTSWAGYLNAMDTLTDKELGIFNYSIEGLLPRKDISMGRYGFGILLKSGFARKAASIHPKYESMDALKESIQEQGHRILEATGSLKKNERWKEIYEFERMGLGLLIQGVETVGDRCDLFIGGHEIETVRSIIKDNGSWREEITYSDHNVDSSIQAYELLALWNLWYETISNRIMNKTKAKQLKLN